MLVHGGPEDIVSLTTVMRAAVQHYITGKLRQTIADGAMAVCHVALGPANLPTDFSDENLHVK